MKEDEGQIGASIAGLAGTRDAPTSDRSCRDGLPHETVLAEIRKNLGIRFIPAPRRNF